MDSNNEVPTKVASPTSDDQMANPNSTNIAGFHQSDTHATAFIRRQIKPLENRYAYTVHVFANYNSALDYVM